jgi:hypothetical protein
MRNWLIAATLLLPSVASASDPSLNVGMVDVVATGGENIGAYPYVAVSLVVPKDRVTLIPTIGVEWSPELGAWGIAGGLVVDVPVAKRVGVDVIATLIHDQPGASFANAAFYGGLGGGVSVFCDEWTLSPSISLLRGLNVNSWTLAPALNVSRAF